MIPLGASGGSHPPHANNCGSSGGGTDNGLASNVSVSSKSTAGSSKSLQSIEQTTSFCVANLLTGYAGNGNCLQRVFPAEPSSNASQIIQQLMQSLAQAVNTADVEQQAIEAQLGQQNMGVATTVRDNELKSRKAIEWEAVVFKDGEHERRCVVPKGIAPLLPSVTHDAVMMMLQIAHSFWPYQKVLTTLHAVETAKQTGILTALLQQASQHQALNVQQPSFESTQVNVDGATMNTQKVFAEVTGAAMETHEQIAEGKTEVGTKIDANIIVPQQAVDVSKHDVKMLSKQPVCMDQKMIASVSQVESETIVNQVSFIPTLSGKDNVIQINNDEVFTQINTAVKQQDAKKPKKTAQPSVVPAESHEPKNIAQSTSATNTPVEENATDETEDLESSRKIDLVINDVIRQVTLVKSETIINQVAVTGSDIDPVAIREQTEVEVKSKKLASPSAVAAISDGQKKKKKINQPSSSTNAPIDQQAAMKAVEPQKTVKEAVFQAKSNAAVQLSKPGKHVDEINHMKSSGGRKATQFEQPETLNSSPTMRKTKKPKGSDGKGVVHKKSTEETVSGEDNSQQSCSAANNQQLNGLPTAKAAKDKQKHGSESSVKQGKKATDQNEEEAVLGLLHLSNQSEASGQSSAGPDQATHVCDHEEVSPSLSVQLEQEIPNTDVVNMDGGLNADASEAAVGAEAPLVLETVNASQNQPMDIEIEQPVRDANGDVNLHDVDFDDAPAELQNAEELANDDHDVEEPMVVTRKLRTRVCKTDHGNRQQRNVTPRAVTPEVVIPEVPEAIEHAGAIDAWYCSLCKKWTRDSCFECPAGCKKWFHYKCAGYENEEEIETNPHLFMCEDCQKTDNYWFCGICRRWSLDDCFQCPLMCNKWFHYECAGYKDKKEIETNPHLFMCDDCKKTDDFWFCSICNRWSLDNCFGCVGACKRWFHYNCAGLRDANHLSQNEAKGITWKCSDCLSGRGNRKQTVTASKKQVANKSANIPKKVSANQASQNKKKIWNCPVCKQSSQYDSVGCNRCDEWTHLKCAGYSKSGDVPFPFCCIKCYTSMPREELAQRRQIERLNPNAVTYPYGQKPKRSTPASKSQKRKITKTSSGPSAKKSNGYSLRK